MDLAAWASKFEKKIQEYPQNDPSRNGSSHDVKGAVAKASSMANQSAPNLAGSGEDPRLKFPAAFVNAQAARRALPAREPAELMLGAQMTDFAKMVCSQLADDNPQSDQVRAAKNETQLIEAIHCKARLIAAGGPLEQVEFISLRITQLQSEIQVLRQAAAQEQQSNAAAYDQQQQMAMMQQYMQQMMQNPQMQQQAQQAMQQMENPQMQQMMRQQTGGTSQQKQAQSAGSNASDANPQGDAVFDAVFEAQQAQYMRQLEFMNQVKTQDAPSTLIGHPTGKIYECRFADDFRPLKYCKNFFSPQGCLRSAMCTYAHCFEELHPNVQEMEKGTAGRQDEEMDPDECSKSVPDMKMKRKKELCNKFKRDGECLLGKHCPFAHGEHEIGTVELCVMEQVKVKLCVHWKENKCYYGKRCVNAHGEAEIGTKKPAFRPAMQSTKKRQDGQSIEEWRRTLFNPKFLASQGL